jgi:leucyl aminopeptidase
MIPTSTDVAIQVKAAIPVDVEAVVYFAPRGATSVRGALGVGGQKAGDEKAAGEQVAAKKGAAPDARAGSNERSALAAADRLLARGVATGKAREVVFDLLDDAGKLKRVYVAGLGEAAKITTETLRQAAGAVARALRKHRISRSSVAWPVLERIDGKSAIDAIVTGFMLASFSFTECKGTASKEKGEEGAKAKGALLTVLAGGLELAAAKAVAERARVICDGQNFCRTIAWRPGNNINPPSLAKVAREMAREVGLDCKVMDEKRLAELGMGGILGVGKGSIQTPPRLIVLEHKPKAKKKGKAGGALAAKPGAADKPVLVVGKSITFDTGGISIKPADKMQKMIFDKAGGMAVLGLMYIAATLDLPVHIVGVLPAAENAISSMAYRPGDVLKMYNGVTVEVTNTDAEGRLVLGDAIAWGIQTYKPSAVIDLATLTGGVIVALGRTMAGVMSNSDALVAEIGKAADAAGELWWRLPVGEDQREQLKSEPADIMNSAGREGHPLQGGAFLSYFVPRDGSVPWAHLDIAGVADTDKELPYYAKGATGWGVRTLVNWVESRAGK